MKWIFLFSGYVQSNLNKYHRIRQVNVNTSTIDINGGFNIKIIRHLFSLQCITFEIWTKIYENIYRISL